jgi:putative membrane protein
MKSTLTRLAYCSALAIVTASCGGSTPSSNTASAAAEPQTTPDAQPSTTASTDTSADAHGSGSDASSATPGSTGAMPATLTDQQIAEITDSVNSAEIEQARLAMSKSKNDEVQSFAGMMVEHHGDAKKKQDKLDLSKASSPLSLKLAAETQQTLDQLKQKSGAEFDRAYLQAQIDGHQKVLRTIDDQLLPNAQSAELKAYLREIRPTVAQHLERAQAAQQKLASTASDVPHTARK